MSALFCAVRIILLSFFLRFQLVQNLRDKGFPRLKIRWHRDAAQLFKNAPKQRDVQVSKLGSAPEFRQQFSEQNVERVPRFGRRRGEMFYGHALRILNYDYLEVDVHPIRCPRG